MQIHQIKSGNSQKKARRVGRGGKRGTFSGRGVKGQKSRAGRKIRPEWRDLVKQIPKRRGYRFKPVSEKKAVLNLGDIAALFSEGEIVSPLSLVARGAVGRKEGRLPEVKILGGGEISKKLSFVEMAVSASARVKIEKAGGIIR